MPLSVHTTLLKKAIPNFRKRSIQRLFLRVPSLNSYCWHIITFSDRNNERLVDGKARLKCRCCWFSRCARNYQKYQEQKAKLEPNSLFIIYQETKLVYTNSHGTSASFHTVTVRWTKCHGQTFWKKPGLGRHAAYTARYRQGKLSSWNKNVSQET